MGIEKREINEMKKNIEGYVGQRVMISGSLGRNKSFEKEGTLMNTYPNYFSVKWDNMYKLEDYHYTDVINGNVKLEINTDNGFDSILNAMSN